VAKKRRRARGASGIAARIVLAVLAFGFGSAAYAFLTLPNVRILRTQNPLTTAFEELRAREAAARGEPVRHVQRWVPYAKISQSLKRAVLVAEDSTFWQHDGIDLAQIKDALEVNIERREFVRGASTITQQLAKNLYLSPSKNPMRKLRELLIARRLEAELSKQRILELYLNVIEWGDGIYGAEAAAREYFHTSAAQLGPEQSALLAAAIINPRLLAPAHPTARLRRRQQMILRRMGAVTPPPASPVESPPALEPVPMLPSAVPSGPPDTVPGEELPAAAPPETPR
jgi:monofunctional biosynthetic peptidoglycan transglycosylase